ncbi:uncharacterized protein FTOL_08836 [Fusarium torulosum]|uniref:Xylanolytic transcriptional activator regulatory domain-containing protein n=1 Tax=Fusarium torulosum TaxID=33205 RepID=A0AAE8MDB0_9HYPO|nr:uncharacterized protein FTOL_08836 [Fusarium torulosum]
MNTIAAIRRRRRRVAENNRKRASGANRSSLRSMPTEGTTASTSQTPATLQTNTSIHSAENIVWPRFLNKLREAFSLDSLPGFEEQNIITSQVPTGPPTRPSSSERVRLTNVVDSFPPWPVAQFLVHVCMKHGVDVFFYFDQTQISNELDQFYNDTSSPLRSDPSFVCLLLAIFALGSQWTFLERRGNPPSVPEGDLGRMFFQQASSLIPDILEDDSIRSIQACFILSVYLMPMNAVGTSYLYMSMALKKALSLGLHQNPDDLLEERERETRRRLWWSIYSLERCTAIKLNRPRSVLSTSVEVPLPAPLQDLDRGQKFNNVLLQIAYARLITIMDTVVDPESTITDDDRNERLTSMEDNLKEWKNSLPEGFSLDAIPPSDSRYRAVFHLYLNYYYTRVIMGKASLIKIVRMTLRYHLGQDAQSWIIDDSTEKLARSCKRASKKLLYLFEGLDETSGTTRSAFTYFQACSIATIVSLIAGILERGFGYQRRVDLGLGLLRGMAAGNLTAEMGVKLVESLQSISDEASRKLSLSRQPFRQSHDEEPLSSSRYNDWTEWLANQRRPQASDDALMQGAAAVQPFVASMTPSIPQTELETAAGLGHDSALSLRALGMLDSLMTSSSVQQPLHVLELDLPNSSHSTTENNDDQAILMSLTGLDVSDFAALSSGAVE